MALRTKSAQKKHRQSLKRRERNKNLSSSLKTKIKQFNSAIEEKDIEKSRELLKGLVSAVDKAATKGLLHKGNSSRRVSRYSRKLHDLEQSVSSAS